MWPISNIFVIFILVALCWSHRLWAPDTSHQISRRETPEDMRFISDFSWKMFRNAKLESLNSNFIMSPISIHLCLALLQQTAVGETRNQIKNLIGEINPQVINDVLYEMRASRSKNELLSATAMFYDVTFNLNETFLETSKKSVVEIVPVNFRNIQQADKQINSWISKVTKGHIERIVEADSLRITKLVLSNGIYFRGLWKNSFVDDRDGIFQRTSTDSKTVTFMKIEEHMRWGMKFPNEVGYQWIEIPYDEGEYSMFIVLPVERWGLEEMIAAMSETDLYEIINGIAKDPNYEYGTSVRLRLPQFKVDSEISLVDTLMELGVSDMFSELSNMPYLANGESITIDEAIQKAVLNVDKEGTVASVSTTFQDFEYSFVEKRFDMEITVDQPFLSIIVDNKQNLPIFISKIYNP